MAIAAPNPAPRRTAKPVAGKNLVVCCDGTGNEIGVKLSNVMKLYRVCKKDDSQLVYYDPGIGTVAFPSTWGRLHENAKGVFGMTTGWGLDSDVLEAYQFLCRNYVPGDAIYLFGFSRGAYTVRVLAGLIQLVGLLRPHQTNFASYALKAYKAASEGDDFEIAWQFRRVVNGQFVTIDFLGVWDTVASVIVPGRKPFTKFHLQSLPYTNENPSVRVFRHAMAIDEFRRMFRLQHWREGQEFKPNPFAKVEKPVMQDSKQVWFAGCHSDVGGGYIEDESSLSKLPLAWMVTEAKAAGLRFDTAMVNHIVLGSPRANARDYAKPDSAGMLHRSLTIGWKPLEAFPKSVRYRESARRYSFLGYYLPLGEPRAIAEGSLVHASVIERVKSQMRYRPSNLPTTYTQVP
jgi:uncharacterized protein (DUF2235 family)